MGLRLKREILNFKIIDTPVHAYDSVSILIDDVLFVGNIFQTGILNPFEKNKDFSTYEHRIISEQILSLPEQVVIYPSKGPPSTVEIEKKFNPYFNKIKKII